MNSRTSRPIRKLLIANRSEIALRIIRAARQLGIQTVAVYSEADRLAEHVRQADEAWCLGGPAPLDSYLKIERIMEVALASGADAIHPGYGFVSENPLLPRACAQAGIRLVGPDEQAMADMADKARAKQIAEAAGLPCIPGFNEPNATIADCAKAAERIGYPVMVKALAGGGGRGMRLAASEADLASAIHSAKTEAKNAFNDDRIMLEKAVQQPRHVEIQVLADQHGHAIHLGERDCTVQRRHQKIIEEAPSPAVDESRRQRMGEAALKLVKATGYTGAGTVEFLLEPSGDFYFIEMNTRLQVEHGVTELITGIDLVQWQLRIAGGEPLTLQQQDVCFNGHAIQGRLCAEDPFKEFLPQTGTALLWKAPEGIGIRVDHALRSGLDVSPWYDSMLAKVMAHGANRHDACAKLANALASTELIGFEHNAAYLRRIVENDVFLAGEFSTAFLAEQGGALLNLDRLSKDALHDSPEVLAAAALLSQLELSPVAASNSASTSTSTSASASAHGRWPAGLSAFSSTEALERPVRLQIGDEKIDLATRFAGRSLEGRCLEVRFPGVPTREAPRAELYPALMLTDLRIESSANAQVCLFKLNGRPCKVLVCPQSQGLWVKRHGTPLAVWVQDLSRQSQKSASDSAFNPLIKSPMNGKVLSLSVKAGDRVKPGDLLASLEAMKMEHRLTARHEAVVEEVLAAEGQQMGQGQLMIRLAPLAQTNADSPASAA